MIIKERSFYRDALAFAAPIALQNIITTMAGIIDTIMLGRLGGDLGDIAVSGASLGNQPSFLMMIICFGLASGGVVLIAQYWGKGEKSIIPTIMGIPMRFAIGLSVAFTAVCFLFPELIMGLLTDEAVVIDAGVKYLRVVCLSYIPNALVSTFIISIRGLGQTRFSVLVYGGSCLINVFFNYCFIFGKLGFPRLEIAGAAVGTVLARLFELLIISIFMHTESNLSKFRWRDIFRKSGSMLRDYLKYSMPVTGGEFAWVMGSVVTAAIMGHLGRVVVAANSVVNVVQQLAMVAMFGIGNATAVFIGNAVGNKNPEYAKRVGSTMLLISVFAGVASSILVLALRTPVIAMFDISAEAKAAAREIMTIMALVMLMSGLEVTVITGVLRGAGDTKFALLVDSGAMWLVGVPLGLLAAFVWKLPVVLVYLLMRMDMPVRLAVSLPRVLRGRYIKNVTREIE